MRNNQLKIGKEVEKEHKPTFDFIREFFEETGELPSEELFYSHIAQDHLVEISDYYDRLEEMEQEAKEENSIEKCITTSELPNLLKNTIIITDFQKAIMEIDFDDIEKARSVRKDTSKLIKKIITNKAGKKQTVWAIAYEEPKKESSGVDGAIEKLQHRISINEKILSARDNSSSTNNEMFVRVQKENDELNKKLNELKEQKKKLEIRKETKKKISESKGEKMFDKIADSQKLDKPMNDKDFWWQLSKQEKNEYLAITRRKNPEEIKRFRERVLGIKSEPKVEEKPEKVVEKPKEKVGGKGSEHDQKSLINKQPSFIKDTELWKKAVKTATNDGTKMALMSAAVAIYKNKEKMIGDNTLNMVEKIKNYSPQKEESKETPKKIKLSPFAINQKLTSEGVAVSSKIADEDDNLILNYTSDYKITDSLKNRMRAKLNSMGFKKIQVTDSNIIIDNSENNIEKAE